MKKLLTCFALLLALCVAVAVPATFAYDGNGTTVSVADAEYAAGATGTADFTVNAGSGIAAFQFTVLYNADFLTVESVKCPIEGNSFTANKSVAGEISVAGNLEANLTDETVLFTVTYTVSGEAEAGSRMGWEIDDGKDIAIRTMNGTTPQNIDNVEFSFGTVRAGITGDVDMNGEVDLRDLMYMQMHLVGIQPLSAAALLNADVDGDSVFTLDDAQYVKMFIVELIPDLVSVAGNSDPESPEHTVFFFNNDGSLAYGYELVKEGNRVIKLPQPDYDPRVECFLGWFTVDENGKQTAFDENTAVYDDLNVYAMFVPVPQISSPYDGKWLCKDGNSIQQISVLNGTVQIVSRTQTDDKVIHSVTLDGKIQTDGNGAKYVTFEPAIETDVYPDGSEKQHLLEYPDTFFYYDKAGDTITVNNDVFTRESEPLDPGETITVTVFDPNGKMLTEITMKAGDSFNPMNLPTGFEGGELLYWYYIDEKGNRSEIEDGTALYSSIEVYPYIEAALIEKTVSVDGELFPIEVAEFSSVSVLFDYFADYDFGERMIVYFYSVNDEGEKYAVDSLYDDGNTVYAELVTPMAFDGTYQLNNGLEAVISGNKIAIKSVMQIKGEIVYTGDGFLLSCDRGQFWLYSDLTFSEVKDETGLEPATEDQLNNSTFTGDKFSLKMLAPDIWEMTGTETYDCCFENPIALYVLYEDHTARYKVDGGMLIEKNLIPQMVTVTVAVNGTQAQYTFERGEEFHYTNGDPQSEGKVFYCWVVDGGGYYQRFDRYVYEDATIYPFFIDDGDHTALSGNYMLDVDGDVLEVAFDGNTLSIDSGAEITVVDEKNAELEVNFGDDGKYPVYLYEDGTASYDRLKDKAPSIAAGTYLFAYEDMEGSYECILIDGDGSIRMTAALNYMRYGDILWLDMEDMLCRIDETARRITYVDLFENPFEELAGYYYYTDDDGNSATLHIYYDGNFDIIITPSDAMGEAETISGSFRIEDGAYIAYADGEAIGSLTVENGNATFGELTFVSYPSDIGIVEELCKEWYNESTETHISIRQNGEYGMYFKVENPYVFSGGSISMIEGSYVFCYEYFNTNGFNVSVPPTEITLSDGCLIYGGQTFYAESAPVETTIELSYYDRYGNLADIVKCDAGSDAYIGHPPKLGEGEAFEGWYRLMDGKEIMLKPGEALYENTALYPKITGNGGGVVSDTVGLLIGGKTVKVNLGTAWNWQETVTEAAKKNIPDGQVLLYIFGTNEEGRPTPIQNLNSRPATVTAKTATPETFSGTFRLYGDTVVFGNGSANYTETSHYSGMTYSDGVLYYDTECTNPWILLYADGTWSYAYNRQDKDLATDETIGTGVFMEVDGDRELQLTDNGFILSKERSVPYCYTEGVLYLMYEDSTRRYAVDKEGDLDSLDLIPEFVNLTYIVDGTVFDSMTVEKNRYIYPSDIAPEKDGYDFLCWYKIGENGVKTDIDSYGTTLNEDTVFYAFFVEEGETAELTGEWTMVGPEDMGLPTAPIVAGSGYSFIIAGQGYGVELTDTAGIAYLTMEGSDSKMPLFLYTDGTAGYHTVDESKTLTGDYGEYIFSPVEGLEITIVLTEEGASAIQKVSYVRYGDKIFFGGDLSYYYEIDDAAHTLTTTKLFENPFQEMSGYYYLLDGDTAVSVYVSYDSCFSFKANVNGSICTVYGRLVLEDGVIYLRNQTTEGDYDVLKALALGNVWSLDADGNLVADGETVYTAVPDEDQAVIDQFAALSGTEWLSEQTLADGTAVRYTLSFRYYGYGNPDFDMEICTVGEYGEERFRCNGVVASSDNGGYLLIGTNGYCDYGEYADIYRIDSMTDSTIVLSDGTTLTSAAGEPTTEPITTK